MSWTSKNDSHIITQLGDSGTSALITWLAFSVIAATLYQNTFLSLFSCYWMCYYWIVIFTPKKIILHANIHRERNTHFPNENPFICCDDELIWRFASWLDKTPTHLVRQRKGQTTRSKRGKLISDATPAGSWEAFVFYLSGKVVG